MDFSPVLQPVFHALWYLVPLFILAGILKSPWFKGKLGEFLVNTSARLLLDKNQYHLIKNVTLPTEDGTTQIDHIIVSRYGVFVVETKNIKGWIFGSAKQRYWTQKIFKHSQKFQNPLHQNYKHVKTLQSLLELSDQQVHSLVVFVGDSTFKTKMPGNVTQGGGYIRFIKSHSELVLSSDQVHQVIHTIESGRLKASLRTDRAHARHVQEIVGSKGQGDLFCGVTEADRISLPVPKLRKVVRAFMPLVFVSFLFKAFSVFMPTSATPSVASRSSNAGQQPPESQRLAAQQEVTRLEAERARREELERARLAAEQKTREAAMERAFLESYEAPAGCDNWRSDRHMVECVNHRIRARAGFLGSKG